MEREIDILLLPLQGLQMLVGRMQYWLLMRPWGLLIQGSPALLVGLLLPAIAIYESKGWDADALVLYQRLVQEAVDEGDQAAAEIYLRKLQMLDENGVETRFAQARLAELRGQGVAAERLMHQLAPPTGSGHPRAHYWVATQLLRDDPSPAPDRIKLLVHHLEAALGSSRDRQAARLRLADIERNRGNLEAAARHLEAVVSDYPEKRLTLSAVYADMGNATRADQERERAIAHFRDASLRDATNIDAAIRWAEASALDSNFGAGERILLDAIAKQRPANAAVSLRRIEKLERRLADHYVQWADHLTQDRPASMERRVDMLEKSLKAVAGHTAALDRLARIAAREAAGDERLARRVNDMLADAYEQLGDTASSARYRGK